MITQEDLQQTIDTINDHYNGEVIKLWQGSTLELDAIVNDQRAMVLAKGNEQIDTFLRGMIFSINLSISTSTKE